MSVEAYRTPDERFEELPGWPYAPRYVEQDGLRLHYVDEGAGEPVLLLHGEPTWGYLYRKLIPPLAALARVVVPDHFGFGRSDKPVAPEWYSYAAHSAALARFVEELDLRGLTLVVHDWGGPIGMRLATEHSERVERLVILNTGIGAGRAPSEEWLRFRDFVRRLGTELSAGRLVQLSCVTELPDDVIDAYDAPFPTPESKAGMLMFPELGPAERGHPEAGAHTAVREAMSRWEKPALVLFSDSDRVFSPRHAERLAAHVPGALPAETIEGGGHFLQEDRGEAIAERIVRFLAETR